MLAGIYYGCQYGGSTTAILVKLPGESASVVTCLDGHEMARQGRAGPGARDGGDRLRSSPARVGTMLIARFGPPLAELALKFGAPEYFSLMVMGLIASAVLASGSMLKAIAMIFLGLLFGIVGTDVNSGMSRFTFGVAGADRRPRLHGRRDGPVRLRRDPLESRPEGGDREPRSAHEEDRRTSIRRWEDMKHSAVADRARHRASARSSARCPAPARPSPRSPPTCAREEDGQATRRASAKARSKASPGPKREQRGGADARSFRR